VCPVIADLAAYVDWSKDGEAVDAGWLRYRVRQHDGTLVVRDVERTDAGVFQCSAVNGFGSAVYRLSVIVRPTPRQYAPREVAPQNLWSRYDVYTLQSVVQPVVHLCK